MSTHVHHRTVLVLVRVYLALDRRDILVRTLHQHHQWYWCLCQLKQYQRKSTAPTLLGAYEKAIRSRKCFVCH